MNGGFLDLAAPALASLDRAMAPVAPPAIRLVLWGLLAAAFSMALYAALSPQDRLRRVRDEAVEARRALDGHDGSFAEARPLMARMFATSMKQLGLVLAPAVIASLPLLFMLTWLYGAFGYVMPERPDSVVVHTDPRGYSGSLQSSQVASTAPAPVVQHPSLVVRDGSGRVVEERPLNVPVTALHKEQWWNLLIANPLGYLPDDSPLHWVTIDLPRLEVLDVGPWWMRTWEFVFFTTLVAVSLAIKLLFRLV